MPDSFVIVGADGTEHEFPAGVDPKQAAAIVRGQGQSQAEPSVAGGPETYWGGFGKGLAEGVTGGAKGFAQGLARSPLDLVSGAIQTVRHPLQTAVGLAEGVRNLPDTIQSAGTDPEAWGRGVGSLTGQTMLSVGLPRGVTAARRGAPAAARAVRRAGRATARGTGTVLESAGQHPWMLGAGGYGGFGSTGALAAIAASPALKATGKALQRIGRTPDTPAASPRPRPSGPRPPTEGVEVERLFRALARKPILTPAEQLQFEQLQRIVSSRASNAGLSYASGGKRGTP